MNQIQTLLIALILIVTTAPAQGDSLLLVHGYLSSHRSWHENGIVRILAANGWSYTGNFAARGLQPAPGPTTTSNRTYSVDLPFDAALKLQTDVLNNMINAVANRHPGESIVLAGHSAGGVVARMALVTNPHPAIDTLITIASPHIGTPRAAEALSQTDDDGPMGLVKGWLGGDTYHTVRRSRSLLNDLLPANINTTLGWLNTRKHPEIRYVSIVRRFGDELMPAFSQDMNQIPALRGKSHLIITNRNHSLAYPDGQLLLAELQRRPK